MRQNHLTRAVFFLLVMTCILAVADSARAQNTPPERFTFVPANFAGAPPMDIVIKRWSSDAERERVVTAAAGGVEELSHPIATAYEVGYIDWPGAVQYILRYASRVSRPDGGQDIILATDRPINVWWDAANKPAPTQDAVSVIQLRLDKAGRGEGKVAIGERITSDKPANTIVVEDFTTRPALLTNVQRAGANTD
jgi:hypothetical protein